MSLKPFPIVGLVKGQQTDVKPAMLPENAWQILENAYTFRERELKREGTQLLQDCLSSEIIEINYMCRFNKEIS